MNLGLNDHHHFVCHDRKEVYTITQLILFFIRIYVIRISRLKFAIFYFWKCKAEAEILKRIDIILCSNICNTIKFYVFNLTA